MKRFTEGVITGGLLGAVGIALALSDRGTRKKVLKGGKKMLHETAETMDDIKSKIW